MAEEKEDKPTRAWLLIKTEVPINDQNWPDIRYAFDQFRKKFPSVIRADWVEGEYDLVVPVDAKNDEVFRQIVDEIGNLTFSPNKAKEIKIAKVKEHNPTPPPQDPLRDNEWG